MPDRLQAPTLETRLAAAVDVSGAFDNCFFHACVLHLFVNKLPLPEDLFNFSSLLTESSPASKLKEQFPNEPSLSLFERYAKLHEIAPSNFIVEKTLVLGILMREWFATKMLTQFPKNLETNFILQLSRYKELREQGFEDQELSQSEYGALYDANKDFLTYFNLRQKKDLTAEEQRFEGYFTKNGGKLVNSITAYWEAEGLKNYCTYIATTNKKLSYIDLAPIEHFLNQSFIIYGMEGNTINPSKSPVKAPLMELKLAAEAGHYYLLRPQNTPDADPLLEEYAKSYKQYTLDREHFLADRMDKVSKTSLLVEAICSREASGKDPYAAFSKISLTKKPHNNTPQGMSREDPLQALQYELRAALAQKEELRQELSNQKKLREEQQQTIKHLTATLDSQKTQLQTLESNLTTLHAQNTALTANLTTSGTLSAEEKAQLAKELEATKALADTEKNRLLKKLDDTNKLLNEEKKRLIDATEYLHLMNPYKTEFDKKIAALKAKESTFEDDTTRTTVTFLRIVLEAAGNTYFNTIPPTPDAYRAFRETCDPAINNARKVIETHRGWKMLANLIGFILGVGLLYAFAAGINYAINKKFTFLKTNSALLIEDIEEDVKKSAPTAPAA